MLGKLKESAPTIVEEMKTDNIKPSILHQVLVNLLQEQVSITALEPIVEAFLQHFLTVKDVPELTERARTSIGHLIADRFRTDQGQVRVIYLEPTLAQLFKSRVHDGMIMLKQRQLERLIEQLRNEWEVSMAKGELAAVIVDSALRRPLRKTIFRSLPDVSVLAYSELPATSTIHPVGAIRQADVWGNDPDSEPVMDWEPPSSRAA
jgi:flagellar biosynthesis protein FlhA